MKQIMEEYGTFLLEGMVLVMLLGLLFLRVTDADGNKGIFAMIGAKADIQSFDYENYTDYRETVQKECQKTAPLIYYTGSTLQTGIIRLADIIYARDYAGEELKIKVNEIQNPLGESVMDAFLQDTMELELKEAGIYTVFVSVKDDGNRIAKCMIKIPVNQNGEET